MQKARLTAVLLAASVLISACGVDVAVTATRSDLTPVDISTPPDPTHPTPPDPSLPDPPVTTEPRTSDPGPPSTESPGSSTTVPAIVDPGAIDFGPNKTERPYDDFLLATLTDLNTWWTDTYPLVYGAPWEPLAGGVYAAYPDRPDDLPGCESPRTTYDEVQQFAAFYCGLGDFMIYDDGDDSLLLSLATAFGPGTIGIVLAHEYGHAIQQRSGALDENLPTVVTEQQADCFAGAWAGRAARSEGGISFTDADVRSGLIAMLEVRDPVGIDQFTPGGHGSGFDRVGAFQTGFVEGPVRCGELIDAPLPLVPNQFTTVDDQLNEGNAPFGFDPGDPETGTGAELFGFLVPDLNLFWGNDVAVPGYGPLTLVPVQSVGDIDCGDLRSGFDSGAALCPSTSTVYLNEPVARDLYAQSAFGDFSLGYLIGVAWADQVQIDLGSTLEGESRALVNDCLAGAWVQSVIPIDFQLPEPRDPGRTASVSPGDLDEAVRTAILIGDLSADDDVLGSPFEKVDEFRKGVIDGLDACAL